MECKFDNFCPFFLSKRGLRGPFSGLNFEWRDGYQVCFVKKKKKTLKGSGKSCGGECSNRTVKATSGHRTP